MPGGGPGSISPELADGLRCNDRTTGLRADANPVQIYYNLGMDRVHFVPQTNQLYFTKSEHFPVVDIIQSVFVGLGCKPDIEQLYLDEHGYYKGAQRLSLSTEQANTLLVALRLKSIKISVALELI